MVSEYGGRLTLFWIFILAQSKILMHLMNFKILNNFKFNFDRGY